MNRVLIFISVLTAVVLPVFIFAAFSGGAQSQTADHPSLRATPVAEEKVPTMDGAAGPCSLELTITSPDGKRAYAVTVRVHIAYGFAGTRRLDLEAGTNSDGKVKFTGIPARVHRPPLEFSASKDELSGVATYDPSAECQAKHDITLTKVKPSQADKSRLSQPRSGERTQPTAQAVGGIGDESSPRGAEEMWRRTMFGAGVYLSRK